MRTVKVLTYIIILIILSRYDNNVTAQESHCRGCKRTAVLKEAINVERISIESRLAEFGTSPCFHLLDTEAVSGFISKEIKSGIPTQLPIFKKPEYYFTVEYEDDLEGEIQSRLTIKLWFYNHELVHTWQTESGRPKFTFNGHLNRMFKNKNAVFKETIPLDIHVINHFEKRPYSCKINTEKDTLIPGDEMEVTIDTIEDIEGNPSREFNRIIVQAVHGEVVGGADLRADPDLKAFMVGDGKITFRYRAPSPTEAKGVSEDMIYVYNACEVLDTSDIPLELTSLKDKIAQKKITIKKKQPYLEFDFSVNSQYEKNGINYKENGSYQYQGRLKYNLKLTDSRRVDGELHQSYEASDCQIMDITGSSKGKTVSWDAGHKRKRTVITNLGIKPCFRKCQASSLSIVFDQEGNVKKVILGGFDILLCLNGTSITTDYDGKTHSQSIPLSPNEKMTFPESFLLDPQVDWGFLKVEGKDSGELKSGNINGTRILTESSDARHTVKHVKYKASL
ncbi:MAG: hypothetical protein D6734_10080 [Candidatus Schekmanbacteria bacterium]|nr:MAG: hypothetical protein D6734_10080 [Candidatus Schekmanbacteria bacterium]